MCSLVLVSILRLLDCRALSPSVSASHAHAHSLRLPPSLAQMTQTLYLYLVGEFKAVLLRLKHHLAHEHHVCIPHICVNKIITYIGNNYLHGKLLLLDFCMYLRLLAHRRKE